MTKSELNKVLTVGDIRKLLRSKKIANCFVWVKVTEDDGYNFPISKKGALETIRHLSPEAETNAIKAGCDLLIG